MCCRTSPQTSQGKIFFELYIHSFKHGACAALVNLTLQETALLTTSIRELIARSILAMSHRSDDRGMIIQQGGVKMLMGFAREGSVEGMRQAAQCVARVGIQTNPSLTFPGQR